MWYNIGMNKEIYIKRFWSKVDKTGGCWLWKNYLNTKGYGLFFNGKTMCRVHRYSYELANGPIPKGMTIDHICHNKDESCSGDNSCLHRRCVNPDHLEAVSHQTNCQRGTSRRKFCKYEHPCGLQYNYGKRQRTCKTCVHLQQKDYRIRNWAQPKPHVPKTHCKRGHPFAGENLYINSLGFQECQTCRQEARLRYQNKQKVMA